MSIVRPNSASKTTLFNLITGALPQDPQRGFAGDWPISGWPLHRLAANGVTSCDGHPRF
jgi:ABC-type branched-subunit amino acid transport system ATPase component